MNEAKRRKSSESLLSKRSPSVMENGMRREEKEGTATARTPAASPATPAVKDEMVFDHVAAPKLSRTSSKASKVSKSSKAPSRRASGSPPTPGNVKSEGSGDEQTTRSSSLKLKRPPPALFTEYPDSTGEATSTFEVIKACIYSNKAIGDSMQDGEVMSCECRPDWDGKRNHACGENSDCINRMTNMECPSDDCGCGTECENQRFQRAEYANVSVIKTEKKGYGLRANSDLAANAFLYEYVGEVIDESKFRRRTHKYHEDGIRHFYFMSLGKNEFIDATRKGGLGRFCNHSCNPNCYVDKWVVGEKLRMGIFAKRAIKAGEELVFDYNVDRYGAEPQTCYCGEPNCLGYIGGKTQTDSAPKLSHHTLEALGLEDENWSTATAKKGRRPRKTGEADDDYIQNVQTKPLSEADVTKVMGSLLGCKERWLIYKLLSRIHSSNDEKVPGRVVKMHGYQIFGRIIHEYKEDNEIVLMVLDIMLRFPRITKNKIITSKIDQTVKDLASASENEQVRTQSNAMIEIWNSLELGFRIRRRANDGSDDARERRRNAYDDRVRRSPSRSKSPLPSRPLTPTRPRNFNNRPSFQTQPPRGPRADRDRKQGFNGPPGGPHNEKRHNLPWGWHRKWLQERGKCYYYSNDGQVRWDLPLDPCHSNIRLEHIPGPPPPLGQLPLDHHRMELRKIVASIERQSEKEREEKARQIEVEKQEKERAEQEERRRKKEKEAAKKGYKTYDEEKTKHILQKAYASVVPNMLRKYQEQLGGKDELKAQAKTIVGVLVEKMTRSGKPVVNPHLVCTGEKRVAKVKAFVKPYIEKYIQRKDQHLVEKAAKLAIRKSNGLASEKPSASPQIDLLTDTVDSAAISPTMPDFSPDTPAISTNTMSAPRSVQDGEQAQMAAYHFASTTSSKRQRDEDEAISVSPKRARSDNSSSQEDAVDGGAFQPMEVDDGIKSSTLASLAAESSTEEIETPASPVALLGSGNKRFSDVNSTVGSPAIPLVNGTGNADTPATPATILTPSKKRRADDDDDSPESPKRMRSMDDIDMRDSDEKPPPAMPVDAGVSVC